MGIPTKGTAADNHCLHSIGHLIVNGRCVICGKIFTPPTNNITISEVIKEV